MPNQGTPQEPFDFEAAERDLWPEGVIIAAAVEDEDEGGIECPAIGDLLALDACHGEEWMEVFRDDCHHLDELVDLALEGDPGDLAHIIDEHICPGCAARLLFVAIAHLCAWS